jgi:hypothetical protein
MTKKLRSGVVLAFCLASSMAFAQTAAHHHGSHSAGGHGQNPYAGMQDRAVKALPDQELADLRAGRGMSLALVAELNGYPGPLHTLEMAEKLKLSAEQQARTRALFEQMQRDAAMAGEALIAAETELDALFREKRVTPPLMTAAVAAAANARGQVRETHLRYHLLMMEVLTEAQVTAYSRLRGY